jgi:hypothetical protein
MEPLLGHRQASLLGDRDEIAKVPQLHRAPYLQGISSNLQSLLHKHHTLLVAALAPDADETSQSQQVKFPVTDDYSYVEIADGRVWMRAEEDEAIAGDLSEQEQKVVWATRFAPAANLFNQELEGTAWRSKPTWYIVATGPSNPSCSAS